MPLDLGTLSDTRGGYSREAEGATLTFQRRVYEQERDWADLSSKFSDSKRRYQLPAGMESVQKEKYEHERDRLSRGRTVTFQVLQFEQDYRNAQLSRIRAQADVLMLVAADAAVEEADVDGAVGHFLDVADFAVHGDRPHDDVERGGDVEDFLIERQHRDLAAAARRRPVDCQFRFGGIRGYRAAGRARVGARIVRIRFSANRQSTAAAAARSPWSW